MRVICIINISLEVSSILVPLVAGRKQKFYAKLHLRTSLIRCVGVSILILYEVRIVNSSVIGNNIK